MREFNNIKIAVAGTGYVGMSIALYWHSITKWWQLMYCLRK